MNTSGEFNKRPGSLVEPPLGDAPATRRKTGMDIVHSDPIGGPIIQRDNPAPEVVAGEPQSFLL
jgi:hypothetical protein